MSMIKIDFEFDTPHGVYRDALHLPTNHGMSDAQIEALKRQRVDNWIAAVTAPPPEPEVVEGGEVEGTAGE